MSLVLYAQTRASTNLPCCCRFLVVDLEAEVERGRRRDELKKETAVVEVMRY